MQTLMIEAREKTMTERRNDSHPTRVSRTLVVILAVAIMAGCLDRSARRLLLVNEADEKVFYALSADTGIDTRYSLYPLLPDDSVRPDFVFGSDEAWDYELKRNPDTSLHIFVFPDSVLTDSSIRHGEYQHIKLPLDSLYSLKWRYVITSLD